MVTIYGHYVLMINIMTIYGQMESLMLTHAIRVILLSVLVPLTILVAILDSGIISFYYLWLDSLWDGSDCPTNNTCVAKPMVL